MMGNKQVMKGGDEWEVVTGWRKVMKWCAKAGKKKEVRKKMSKRSRREAKKDIENQIKTIEF